MGNNVQKYANAYRGRFESAGLVAKHEAELSELAAAQNVMKKISLGSTAVARTMVDKIIPESAIKSDFEKKVAKSNADSIDYTKELNGKYWTMNKGQVQETRGADYFPMGEKWEQRLVLTSNCDLTSPISFAETLDAAKEVSAARGNKNVKVIGTYCSDQNMVSNSLDTFNRISELKKNPDSFKNVTSAARFQANLLLDVISERGSNGRPLNHNGKRVIRSDAAEILKHVDMYGYSSGALTNHDATRLLREWTETGALEVKTEKGKFRATTEKDSAEMISQITLIGIAPADIPQTKSKCRIEPKMDYYIGRDTDFSLASLGRGVYQSPASQNNVIATSPTELGGHSQSENVAKVKQTISAK